MRKMPSQLRGPGVLPPQVPESLHGRSAQAPIQQAGDRHLQEGHLLPLLVRFRLSVSRSHSVNGEVKKIPGTASIRIVLLLPQI